MSEEKSQDQITQWLKKLERESWQLELLVSAFTIFLWIGASESFGSYLLELNYSYSFDNSLLGLIVFFLSLLLTSIQVLTAFLIIHLLLRGFWIGAIGLRSVQPSINYEKLNYSEFFLERLKKKVIGLDRLVVILDELCSVIFSLSFLIIFMIISFGLYFLFVGVIGGALVGMVNFFGAEVEGVFFVIFIIFFFSALISGLIYLIDYFTLGFFKKGRRFGKIYYPIYRFYSFITLSFISRSIYYNLISKYSKKRIRLLYLVIGLVVFSNWFMDYDQYQYFPEGPTELAIETNYYDDNRSEKSYVERVSVESKYVSGSFMSLFLRYNPADNERIQSNCPDFEPLKNDGINPRLAFVAKDNSYFIQSQDFEDEDKEKLLECLSSYYEISINDSIYADLKFYFHEHPAKSQKGILTVIPTDWFELGENRITVKRTFVDPDDSVATKRDFATLPIWFSPK